MQKYKKEIIEHEEKQAGKLPFVFDRIVCLRGVSFAYANKKEEVLSGLRFCIKKGELVGLVGPSGSGKTTIVDLLLRLFEPTSGAIFFDEINAGEIKLDSLRRNIGYVSQDMYLANDTVEKNIKFYEDSISDEDMIRAAHMAHVHDVIESLPRGYQTIIGERGVMLSAGQRQRIVIARILARKPQLLILDEATSALDNESELEIQKAIESLKRKITVLVIAHRLETVLSCDNLLVLDKGKILEEGKPQDLLAKEDSYFFKMYNIRT